MVFASPVAASMVSGSHYEGLAGTLYLTPDKLAADYAPVRFERELKLFRSFCPSGRVLDVGCSTGGFLHELDRRWPGAYERLGTDVVSEALNHAERQGVPVMRPAFLEHDFRGHQFDAVTLWAVVEHLVDPAAFMAKAASLLRPGGHCFVLVPNLRSLAARLLGPRYRYVMAEHVNYFSASTLRRLAAREAGWREVALRSTHFNPLVLVQDWRSRGEPVPDSARVGLLKRTTAWKQRASLQWVRWCYGAVERVLGSMRLADNLVLVLRKGG